MSTTPTIILLTGGGVKSAVAAARLVQDHRIHFVHVNFGQRSASAEVRTAQALAAHFSGAALLELDAPHLLQIQQRTGGTDAPRAATAATGVVGTHAISPTSLRGLFPVLLSMGAHAAWRIGAKQVVIGVSRHTDGSHLGLPGPETHPDYLREFLQDFTIATETFGLKTPVAIDAPLVDLTYAQIMQLAVHFQIPLEHTWSCLGPGPTPCGVCAGCSARRSAPAQPPSRHPAAATV